MPVAGDDYVSEALSGECAMWNVLSGKRSAVLLIK